MARILPHDEATETLTIANGLTTGSDATGLIDVSECTELIVSVYWVIGDTPAVAPDATLTVKGTNHDDAAGIPTVHSGLLPLGEPDFIQVLGLTATVTTAGQSTVELVGPVPSTSLNTAAVTLRYTKLPKFLKLSVTLNASGGVGVFTVVAFAR